MSSTAPAPTAIYTLSLHDALPIWSRAGQDDDADLRIAEAAGNPFDRADAVARVEEIARSLDRKSTRLNSSHMSISYAVFCLKKKIKNIKTIIYTNMPNPIQLLNIS